MKQIPAEFWNFPTTSHGVALEYVTRISEVAGNSKKGFSFTFELTNVQFHQVRCGDDPNRAKRIRNEAVNALSKYHLFKELLKACRFHFEPPADKEE